MEEIKSGIEGDYIELTEHILYKKITEILKRFNTDIVLSLQKPPTDAEINTFYRLERESMEVAIIQRY